MMKPTHSNGEVVTSQRAIATKATATPKNSPADSPPQLSHLSPQVSLGMDIKNGLLTSSIVATVIVGVLFVALTVGPYLKSRAEGISKDTAKPAEQAKPENSEPTTPPTITTTPPKANPDPSKPTGPKSDIVGKLGENVAKPASPSSNPLDKKDDDILKDLNK